MSEEPELNPFSKEAEVMAALWNLPWQKATAAEIHRQTSSIYNHVLKIVKKFERLGLVTREPAGREVLIEINEEYEDLFRDMARAVDSVDQVTTNQ